MADGTCNSAGAPGLTVLRIGNVAGADALLGNLQPDRPVLLDPVAGQSRGPLRSYIGPQVLAEVLAQLVMRARRGDALPDVLNVAQAPAVAMADLLDAADQPWCFGPAQPDVVARVAVSVDRLAAVVALPAASAHSLVAD